MLGMLRKIKFQRADLGTLLNVVIFSAIAAQYSWLLVGMFIVVHGSVVLGYFFCRAVLADALAALQESMTLVSSASRLAENAVGLTGELMLKTTEWENKDRSIN